MLLPTGKLTLGFFIYIYMTSMTTYHAALVSAS